MSAAVALAPIDLGESGDGVLSETDYPALRPGFLACMSGASSSFGKMEGRAEWTSASEPSSGIEVSFELDSNDVSDSESEYDEVVVQDKDKIDPPSPTPSSCFIPIYSPFHRSFNPTASTDPALSLEGGERGSKRRRMSAPGSLQTLGSISSTGRKPALRRVHSADTDERQSFKEDSDRVLGCPLPEFPPFVQRRVVQAGRTPEGDDPRGHDADLNRAGGDASDYPSSPLSITSLPRVISTNYSRRLAGEGDGRVISDFSEQSAYSTISGRFPFDVHSAIVPPRCDANHDQDVSQLAPVGIVVDAAEYQPGTEYAESVIHDDPVVSDIALAANIATDSNQPIIAHTTTAHSTTTHTAASPATTTTTTHVPSPPSSTPFVISSQGSTPQTPSPSASDSLDLESPLIVTPNVHAQHGLSQRLKGALERELTSFPDPPAAPVPLGITRSQSESHVQQLLVSGIPPQRPPRTTLLPSLPIFYSNTATLLFSSVKARSEALDSRKDGQDGSMSHQDQHHILDLDGNWRDTASDKIVPVSSRGPHHHKTPSVPCSTKTTSTISGVPLETPHILYTFSQAHQRYSKITAVSGTSSSTSSIYSSDSESTRGRERHFRITGNPDISTVLEEEGSVDINLEKRFEGDRQLKHQTSQATFISHRLQGRGHRTGTVSSGNTNRTGKTSHPFASAIIRAPSPPSSILLRVSSPLLSSSKSAPSLSEMARVPHAPAHQVALAEESFEDDEKCPICVESLSFTFRLPGEKPQVVPECGHALHEECFVHVYGEVPEHGSKRNIGLCGVCRQKMRVVEGGGKRKRSKGKSTGNESGLRHMPSVPSLSSHLRSPQQSLHDPRGDDPIEISTGLATSNSSRSFLGDSQAKVIIPTISVRSEFPSISRGRKSKATTAMVTIEVPPAPDRGRYSARNDMLRSPFGDDHSPHSPRLPPSPNSNSSDSHERLVSPSSRNFLAPPTSTSHFAQLESDLRNRLVDYKTSGMDNLGGLRLFDLIAVRKGAMLKEFLMYLYSDALICISEDKPNAFQKIFSSNSSVRSNDTRSTTGTGSGRSLRLRGRIYVKHIKKLVDSSLPNELSLTIMMENENIESFILTFKDPASHETWKSTLQRVLNEAKGINGGLGSAWPSTGGNSANKIAKLMGAGAPPPAPRSAKSPATPLGSGYGQSFGDFDSTPSTLAFSPRLHVTPNETVQAAPLAPVHTPIDLVVVLSLPATPTGQQLPLKVRLMRQSLAFVLALLGGKDRVSLVACQLGTSVRRTPFLNPTRYESRARLEDFVETLGSGQVSGDEFEVETQADERLDVVTAVNVALDVVLQRKLKNPVTGMILISDTSEVVKRAQMDLVTARLDAANVPVHSIGYGKSHDPSPLWMMSNHTHGTYTFVREWYHLRDTLAGVIGGLMAVALNNMKLHLSATDYEFRITKVTGTTSAIISANGKTVDIELRELRFGEVREILVDVELETGENGGNRYSAGDSETSSPSAEGFSLPRAFLNGKKSPSLASGMDRLSVTDSNNALRDMVYDEGMVGEIPVIEVDCSFHDPAINRTVSRLAHPVLLTLAILPLHMRCNTSTPAANPAIVRRRMELLASDMITRALLLISRKNYKQAGTLLSETRRIVQTMADGMRGNINGTYQARTKKELASVRAVEQMENVVGDMDLLCEALDEQPELFERDHRNYASQQAIVLRSQRSWTTRTGTELWYATEEVKRVIQLSGEWSTRG